MQCTLQCQLGYMWRHQPIKANAETSIEINRWFACGRPCGRDFGDLDVTTNTYSVDHNDGLRRNFSVQFVTACIEIHPPSWKSPRLDFGDYRRGASMSPEFTSHTPLHTRSHGDRKRNPDIDKLRKRHGGAVGYRLRGFNHHGRVFAAPCCSFLHQEDHRESSQAELKL